MRSRNHRYRYGPWPSFRSAPWRCVAFALLLCPGTATAQSDISPSQHVDVSNVTNPGNAWDGNH
jgi:hypothetical protein